MTIDQYKICIECFHIKYSSPSRKLRQRLRSEYFFWCDIFMNFIFFHYVIHILLLTCHDIETNPGPNNPTESSIYCLNIRSLLAVVTEKPRAQKIDHLIAELSANNHSIVLISETLIIWARHIHFNSPMYSVLVGQDEGVIVHPPGNQFLINVSRFEKYHRKRFAMLKSWQNVPHTIFMQISDAITRKMYISQYLS